MKIAVIGTGMVGRTLAGRLEELGHDVVVGTRDVEQTVARTEPGMLGHPPYAKWQPAHPKVRLLPFPEAAPAPNSSSTRPRAPLDGGARGDRRGEPRGEGAHRSLRCRSTSLRACHLVSWWRAATVSVSRSSARS